MERLATTAIILVLLHVAPIASVGAQATVDTGDRVRVSDPRGSRLVQGTVRSIDADSILVGDPAMAISIESFRSGGYRLARRTGSHATEGAAWTGLILGAFSASIGYCFQLLGDGCAADTGQALIAGGYGLAIGAGLGALFGSMVSEYEVVDPGAFAEGVDSAIELRGVGDGRWAVALALRLST